MSNAKHAATYRAKQLAKVTAQAKRVEELEGALREIAAFPPIHPFAISAATIAIRALEGSAKA